MTGPRRLQLSRRRGARLPEGARSVAYPSVYANPFRPAERSREANAAAVARYGPWLRSQPALMARARAELRGRDLACWCEPGLSCHADVLLVVANEPDETT